MINATWLKKILIPLSLICAYCSYGEKADKAFIKENLERTAYPIDMEATAVILREEHFVDITREPHGSSYIYIQTEHIYKLIKIIKSGALKLADVHLFYQYNSGKNYLSDISGTTYNLDGNNVTEAEVGKTDIYKKEISKDHFEVSFLLPGVKEGSVIEYSYNRAEPTEFLLPEWTVQGSYPKLMTEYKLSYPQNFEFTSISHIAAAMKEYPSIADAKAGPDDFCHVRGQYMFAGNNTTTAYWVRKNIPGIKDEPYVVSLPNYTENLVLQRSGYFASSGLRHMDNSWDQVNSDLLKLDVVSSAVDGKNFFMDEATDSIKKAAPNTTIRAIYDYVRNNFKLIQQKGFFSTRSLRTIFVSRAGSTEEINLVLTAMLIHADVPATPLLLSTAGNISPSPAFPVLNRFNYLACSVRLDSTHFMLLDASDKNNVYGQLPSNCYNGYARTIAKQSDGIYLTPDLLTDKNITAIEIYNVTDSGADIRITQKKGLIPSSQLRKSWAKDDKAKQNYLDRETHNLPDNFTLKDADIINEKNPDTGMVITYTGNITFTNHADKWFLASQYIKTMTQNPFKSVTRRLPIEFAYKTHDSYYLTVKLPANVTVQDLPQPSYLDLDSGSIVYKKTYSWFEAMHTLTVNRSYDITATTIPASEYDDVRSFYQDLIKEENEFITFKKTSDK